jgi:ribonuclease HI
LKAAIRALEILSNDLTIPVEIRSDSQYVIKGFFITSKTLNVWKKYVSSFSIVGMTEWIHKWKTNNWKTVHNEDVQNKDLFVRLDELSSQRIVPVKWVIFDSY